MSQETVFRVAVLAAVATGTLCVLVHVQVEHLRRLAEGVFADPWSESLAVVPAWLLFAIVVGGALGILHGILPAILGVALWPTLESRLGTVRAIPALSTVAAIVAAAEVLVSGAGAAWAFVVAVICAVTSAYLLWLNACVVDRSGVRIHEPQ